jgi:uncharacterized membrane protein
MSLAASNTVTAGVAETPAAAAIKSRIASIDIMRGLVIVLMLVDHVREKLYLHMQVGDPMDAGATSPELFFTRISAHLCAPTFVFLTGLSAWLYAHPARGGLRSPSSFLFKRGLFLVFIELTLINFSWSGTYNTLWLQVIWAIGLSMIALSLLVRLPYWLIGLLGFAIVFGHNLLTPISFAPDEFGYTLWTILHERGVLVADGPLQVKVTYPVLPWIGVILLGYFAGPLYSRATSAMTRRKALIGLGLGCLGLLALLRGFNIYGETLPWVGGETAVQTLMSFINFTKYPPSLDFLLITLGSALLLLAWFETQRNKVMDALEVFGSAPMFFYIVHLYVLLIGYRVLLAIFGPTQGELYGVDDFYWVWVVSALMTLLLYYPTRVFANFKHRTTMAWVKYF